MPRPSRLPEYLAESPFTIREAAAASVSPRRLRASDLASPFRGVRVSRELLADADATEQFDLLCRSYAKVMPDGWFFSGPTAARIMGVPLPRRVEKLEVHVTSLGSFAPRGRFVVGHTATAAETTHMFGHRVRVPAEVWCELASVLDLDELIAAGDRMVCDKPVLLTTAKHLEAAVTRHGARRGARKLREALPQLRDDVWSPRESWARLVIVRAGLPEPARNRRILDAHGRLVAIGDLVFERYRVVVEYEGERWHRDAWSGIDVDRYNRLSLMGWIVVRLRKHHTAADVERLVAAALSTRGWRRA